MKLLSIRLFIGILILVFLPIIGCHLNAQQIPLRSQMLYKHCYVHHTDTFSQVPPYSSDMPLEVFQVYFVIDSLCRIDIPAPYNNIDEVFDTLSYSQVDSLLKYIYLTIDYDPARFFAYLSLGHFLDNRYVNYPLEVYRGFLRKALQELGGSRMADLFISFAHGIYEIEVTAVQEDSTFKTVSKEIDQKITCIEASITDVIKGHGLVEICDETINGENQGNLYQCLHFSFANEWVAQNMNDGDDGATGIVVINDSTGESTYVRYLLHFDDYPIPAVGDKYLVFVESSFDIGRDSTGIPYNLFPFVQWQNEGGVFRVEQGNVSDSNNFFGMGTSIALATLKDHIRERIADYILK